MKVLGSVRYLLLVPCLGLQIATEVAPAVAFPHMPSASATSTVDQVQFRRGYGNRSGRYIGRRRGGGNDVGIGLGILGAIIGGAIIAESVGGYGSGSAYDRCARSFRSFDGNSGTYTTYDGDTRRCPYL